MPAVYLFGRFGLNRACSIPLREAAQSAGATGRSRTTSRAGLSSRNPWNAACLKMPSSVQLLNSTWPTSSGRTQWTPLRGISAIGLANGDSLLLEFLESPCQIAKHLRVEARSHAPA